MEIELASDARGTFIESAPETILFPNSILSYVGFLELPVKHLTESIAYRIKIHLSVSILFQIKTE